MATSPVLNAKPKSVLAPDPYSDGYADVVWTDGSADLSYGFHHRRRQIEGP
jgi:hypothetical protein